MAKLVATSPPGRAPHVVYDRPLTGGGPTMYEVIVVGTDGSDRAGLPSLKPSPSPR